MKNVFTLLFVTLLGLTGLYAQTPEVTRIEAETVVPATAFVLEDAKLILSENKGVMVMESNVEIEYPFTISTEGNYQFKVFIRGGYTYNGTDYPTGYANSYTVTIDGVARTFTFSEEEVNSVFWLPVYTEPTNLTAGEHKIKIKMKDAWLALDYIDFYKVETTGMVESKIEDSIFGNVSFQKVQLTKSANVTVYNTLGQQLKSFVNVNQIDLSDFRTGIYIIRANNETKKIIR